MLLIGLHNNAFYAIINEWQTPPQYTSITLAHYMYLELFQNLGLSKNEAEIYEALLEYGESSVSSIAAITNINRRNIYDVLNRMIEKGLVMTVVSEKESTFRPVDPQKLNELLQEKASMLGSSMDELRNLYKKKAKKSGVTVYRGAEGWKNYMRDMIQVGEPTFFLGAKGGWLDERMKHFYPQFAEALKKKKLPMYHLFDWEVKEQFPEILKHVTGQYKFLPKEYSTQGGAVDIFGDHVNILDDLQLGGFGDDDFSFTVIVNDQIADSFRTWFRYMWDKCPNIKENKAQGTISAKDYIS